MRVIKQKMDVNKFSYTSTDQTQHREMPHGKNDALYHWQRSWNEDFGSREIGFVPPLPNELMTVEDFAKYENSIPR